MRVTRYQTTTIGGKIHGSAEVKSIVLRIARLPVIVFVLHHHHYIAVVGHANTEQKT